jgi:hypothetical protein
VTSTIISVSDCLEVEEMSKHFQSGLTGLLLGGLWGGIVGATLLGLDAYLDDSSSLVGPARNWAWLAAIFGLVIGVGIGALLGAIIGASHANQPIGTLIGFAMGLSIAVDPLYDSIRIYESIDPFVVAVIVSCSMLGWLLSSTLQARARPG